MSYSSSAFIFFLVFTLYFYYLAPDRLKTPALLSFSLLWYASWGYGGVAFLLAVAGLNYLAMAGIRRRADRRDLFLGVLIAFDLALFILARSSLFEVLRLSRPLGMSFFMMMLVGLVIDRWRSRDLSDDSFFRWLNFLMFFPLLMGGPIERGKSLIPQFQTLTFDMRECVDGVIVFGIGFLKRFYLSMPLHMFVRQLIEAPAFGSLDFLLLCFLSTFQAYVEFSSYCDMGRGAARMFGVKVSENFRPFYFAENPADFWRRWNISIGTWMRDYFSFPILFRWGRTIPSNLVVFCSFVLIGLWHGSDAHWIYFGMFNGISVVLFISIQSKLRERPGAVRVAGFVLAWLTIIGNGLLQHVHVATLLRQLNLTHLVGEANVRVIAAATLLPMGAAALVLLTLDVLQEWRGELDFFSRFPMAIKCGIAFGFLVWVLANLHADTLKQSQVLLPVYFQL